jgi:hypothetical protein|tara:strand:- start:245 stop:520 length:276 start_codon:yes stop_codon:yes gene_type:complete
MESKQMAEEKKERKSLGVVFPNINKQNPNSYDLKGTITTPDGKKYRVGAYKAEASGDGKLEKGQSYYWMHRVEELEINQAGESFDPASLDS